MRRRGRGPISGTARLSALLRGHAPGTQLGLGRASWNHRMQTGGPSPAPVQRAPRSPARAGRADTQTACRLRATNSARRNRTRSVSRRHRLTSLTMNGMDAVIQILRVESVARIERQRKPGFSQPVGWVERSETHQIHSDKTMGFASAQPILQAQPIPPRSSPSVVPWLARRTGRQASGAARWATGRRAIAGGDGATRIADGDGAPGIIGRRIGIAGATMHGRGRCRDGGAENDCGGQRDCCPARHCRISGLGCRGLMPDGLAAAAPCALPKDGDGDRWRQEREVGRDHPRWSRPCFRGGQLDRCRCDPIPKRPVAQCAWAP